ncbi:PREDICTED: vegetative cell wall protein gp1-like [Vollenhovia emeryi]|uniref:vegetative cell wall protein gp1-like n=1 Tax=Vollenhovia emeryi TaxID=411798 RepID=UPI0005F43117|nr:PREDICTED: vegetative cell wall protein gp1-like [Vollenhovia emeryi]
MGRSRRAGRKVQLRRIARAYSTPGVFDPRVFDRPLEPPNPSLPPPPPYPHPRVRATLPQPPAGVKGSPPAARSNRPSCPSLPDPCPIRTWAPRRPITPAPRPPVAALATAPPAQAPKQATKPPPGPKAPKATLAPRRTKPCIVRIEALPQRIRICRRPKKAPQGTRDMPSLG